MPDADRTPKTERGRQTRTRLLDAAAVEFGDLGYRDASISSITGRAGVALGTFYVHFSSKEAVFRALVAHMGKTTRRYISERLAQAQQDGLVKTRIDVERIGLQSYLEFVRDHKSIYRIVMEAQFVAEDAYRDYYMSFAQAYRTQLEAASEAGEIRSGGEEIHAWSLIGMSVFLGLRYSLWDDALSPAEIAAHASTLIADGLAGGLEQVPGSQADGASRAEAAHAEASAAPRPKTEQKAGA